MAADMLRSLASADVSDAAGALQSVNDALDRLAVNQIEEWFATDEFFEEVPESTLRDVVSHVDDRGNLAWSDINGLDEARETVRLYDEAKQSAEYEAWQASEGFSQRRDAADRVNPRHEVESLMRLLEAED